MYKYVYAHAGCICSLCGRVFVRAYSIGSTLQQIIAFCSVTVPIIGTLQYALAMDRYNIR